MIWPRGWQVVALRSQGETGGPARGGQVAAVPMALATVVATFVSITAYQAFGVGAVVHAAGGQVDTFGFMVPRNIDRRRALQARLDGTHQALRQHNNQHQQYSASVMCAVERHG